MNIYKTKYVEGVSLRLIKFKPTTKDNIEMLFL